jgi:hypothetical protein
MQFYKKIFFLKFGIKKYQKGGSKSFIKPSIWQDDNLAFYDAPFGCYAADRQTDRIPEFNTSLIGRGKNGWEIPIKLTKKVSTIKSSIYSTIRLSINSSIKVSLSLNFYNWSKLSDFLQFLIYNCALYFFFLKGSGLDWDQWMLLLENAVSSWLA